MAEKDKKKNVLEMPGQGQKGAIHVPGEKGKMVSPVQKDFEDKQRRIDERIKKGEPALVISIGDRLHILDFGGGDTTDPNMCQLQFDGEPLGMLVQECRFEIGTNIFIKKITLYRTEGEEEKFIKFKEYCRDIGVVLEILGYAKNTGKMIPIGNGQKVPEQQIISALHGTIAYVEKDKTS